MATFTDIASLNINSNIYINIDLDLRQPTPNFGPMLNFWFTPTNAKFQTHNNPRQILEENPLNYVWSITPTNTCESRTQATHEPTQLSQFSRIDC